MHPFILCPGTREAGTRCPVRSVAGSVAVSSYQPESPARGQRQIPQTVGRHISSLFFLPFHSGSTTCACRSAIDAGSLRTGRFAASGGDRYQLDRGDARRNPVCMSVGGRPDTHPPTHGTTAFRFCWLLRRRSAAHRRPGERPRGRAPRAPALRAPETSSRSLRYGTATGGSPRRWKTPHGRDTCVSLTPREQSARSSPGTGSPGYPRARESHNHAPVVQAVPFRSRVSSRPPCRNVHARAREGREKERASTPIASLSRRCRPFSSTTLLAVAVRVPRVPRVPAAPSLSLPRARALSRFS